MALIFPTLLILRAGNLRYLWACCRAGIFQCVPGLANRAPIAQEHSPKRTAQSGKVVLPVGNAGGEGGGVRHQELVCEQEDRGVRHQGLVCEQEDRGVRRQRLVCEHVDRSQCWIFFSG